VAEIKEVMLHMHSSKDVERFENLPEDGLETEHYHWGRLEATTPSSLVYIARAKAFVDLDHRFVALKFTRPSLQQKPHDPLKEARILQSLKHENIIPLIEAFDAEESQFVLVFPACPLNLATLLRTNSLTKKQAHKVYSGLFSGLRYIHAQGIIHRDIKPDNILFEASDGAVKIIDFGTAWSATDKSSEPPGSKITDVGTTCYRAPEVLFGDKAYGTSLDMWAAGCVVAEVLRANHEPLFDAGDLGSELALIKSMFTTLGTPTSETWPSADRHPDWGKMRFYQFSPKPWKELLPEATDDGIDFVSRLVCYEMTTRMTADGAVNHAMMKTLQI
jgi:cyclin-dependent kinase